MSIGFSVALCTDQFETSPSPHPHPPGIRTFEILGGQIPHPLAPFQGRVWWSNAPPKGQVGSTVSRNYQMAPSLDQSLSDSILPTQLVHFSFIGREK